MPFQVSDYIGPGEGKRRPHRQRFSGVIAIISFKRHNRFRASVITMESTLTIVVGEFPETVGVVESDQMRDGGLGLATGSVGWRVVGGGGNPEGEAPWLVRGRR